SRSRNTSSALARAPPSVSGRPTVHKGSEKPLLALVETSEATTPHFVPPATAPIWQFDDDTAHASPRDGESSGLSRRPGEDAEKRRSHQKTTRWSNLCVRIQRWRSHAYVGVLRAQQA